MAMDKKTKKRLEVLRQKLEKEQKVLAACKAQPDDAAELKQAEDNIAAFKAEIAELRGK
jgi:predicted FMN-binding regulatory protein PaiB